MRGRTVLYVHGLEAGPEGRKSVELRRIGFTVEAHQMPCGRRHIARDPVVLATVAAGLATLAALARRRSPATVGAASAGFLALTPLGQALLFRRVLARSIAVQRAALASARPDVIVASSFGGAVALALLQAGDWGGPTLLLCPAQELVAQRARAAQPTLADLPTDIASRVLIVHGSRDETVPLVSSERLVAGTSSRLIVVDDDHRLKATATGEQLRDWLRLLDVAL